VLGGGVANPGGLEAQRGKNADAENMTEVFGGERELNFRARVGGV